MLLKDKTFRANNAPRRTAQETSAPKYKKTQLELAF
jgi:hypothetical protein